MIKDFEEKVLDDPEFQEDAVREEIIGPILKHLGFKPDRSPKVVRSRKLSHPFVNIGSKTHKINIIPDYVLELEGNPIVVIDAKSPQTSLQNSTHAEQAYSYAIHPEIRAKMYSLCNGREWIIWDIDKFDPIAILKIEEIIKDCKVVGKYLSPRAIQHPQTRDFLPDYGLRLKKLGLSDDASQIFMINPITNISKVEDNLYTINLVMNVGSEDLAISFDLTEKLYQELLNMFPQKTKSEIISLLTRQPFRAFDLEPIHVTLIGSFGEVTQGAFEEFVPVVVREIKALPADIEF